MGDGGKARPPAVALRAVFVRGTVLNTEARSEVRELFHWRSVLAELATSSAVSKQQLYTHLAPLRVLSQTDQTLSLGAPSEFAATYIRENFLEKLHLGVARVTGKNLRIHVEEDCAPPHVRAAALASSDDDRAGEPDAEIQEEIEQENEASRELGFASRLLVQATLPHSKPNADEFVFQRANGFVTVQIIADPRFGLPYGTYPRLLLAYITTEAVRTKCRVVGVGASMRQFMDNLDLAVTGGQHGSINRLRDHMRRLFTSTVSANCQRDGEWQNIGFRPVERVSMFWDPAQTEQTNAWPSAIELNQTFYEEITRKPVPLDMRVLRALSKRRSSLALDIYQWLTHRFSYLRCETVIPWKMLQAQFGCDYGRVRDFRVKFAQHLKAVLDVYPQANVQVMPRGLQLRPSKTHIPMRVVKSRRR